MNPILDYAHQLARDHITPDSIVVDATCGNGNDTLFLANISNHVTAFDIQESAIKATKNLLTQSGIKHVRLIRDSHETITQHVEGLIDFVMFNLGYLPGGDKSITTTASTTIKAIENLLPRLAKGGLIVLVIYIGHPAGKTESTQLKTMLTTLSPQEYYVTYHRLLNHTTSPYVISIKRQF